MQQRFPLDNSNAQAVHDITENHTTLATGFGMDGDAVTGAVDTFLNGLP